MPHGHYRWASGIIALTLATQTASAQCGTTVQGSVSGTWTAAGSPYCVAADLAVGDLVVEAGVLVRVALGVRITVSGSLVVDGTDAEPVVFEAGDPGSPWGGMELLAAAGSSLVHCRITGASDSGLRIVDCTPELDGCVVEDCSADVSGGGIYASVTTGDLVLRDCRLVGNKALASGGGLHAELDDGKLVLERCEVIGNTLNEQVSVGDTEGGGIYGKATGGVELVDCLLEDNLCVGFCNFCFCGASAEGAGVFADECPLTLTRCLLRGNETEANDDPFMGCSGEIIFSRGAGVCLEGVETMVLDNCVFVGNTCSGNANSAIVEGAAATTLRGTILATNCTIARNTVKVSFGLNGPNAPGFHVGSTGLSVIESSIFHGNVRLIFGEQSGTVSGPATVSYSLMEGGWPGTGNLDADPLFAGRGTSCGDVEITPGSPCIDAGNPAPAFDDVAFPPSLGTARNDMGAGGGPVAAGWTRWAYARPRLEVDPSRNPCPATVRSLAFQVSGGLTARPVALVLEAVNGVPLGTELLLAGPAAFCLAGRWQTSLAAPEFVCSVASLTFRAVTIGPGGAIVTSAPYVW